MGKMLARGFHGSLCLFAPWRHPLSSKKLITPGDDGDVLAQNYAQNKIKKNPQTMHTIYIPTRIYTYRNLSLLGQHPKIFLAFPLPGCWAVVVRIFKDVWSLATWQTSPKFSYLLGGIFFTLGKVRIFGCLRLYGKKAKR